MNIPKKKEIKKKLPGKSKIEINPIDQSITSHYQSESNDLDLLDTIFKINNSLSYQLTESERKSLELKSEKYSIPFSILESIFKFNIQEKNQSYAFSNINSLIVNGTINEFFSVPGNEHLKPTDYGVPGNISNKLLLTPRQGYGITRRLRNQIQTKIIDS